MSEPELDYSTATVEQMWERFSRSVLPVQENEPPSRVEMRDAFKAMYMAGFMDSHRAHRATLRTHINRVKALYEEAKATGTALATEHGGAPPQESA